MKHNAALAWAVYRHLLLVAQSPGAPNDGDWSEYFTDVSKLTPGGVLVAGNGKLTPAQREDVESWQKRTNHQTVLLTSSAVSRGIATALGWLGVPVKAFAPDALMHALEHLRLAPEQHREATEIVARLRSALEPPHVRHSIRGA